MCIAIDNLKKFGMVAKTEFASSKAIYDGHMNKLRNDLLEACAKVEEPALERPDEIEKR